MLNSSLNSRTLGILILILTTILLLLNRGFVSVLILFNVDPDTDIFLLLRFVVSLLLRVLLVIFAFYAGVRYLINKPFKRNKSFGLLLVALGILYFLYNFAATLFGYLTGLNFGGWMQPVLTIPGALVLVLLGWGVGNVGAAQEAK
ncbi:MAG TPA: hypothetical protein VGA72_00230 [Anaerolineales bacterium]